jgi:predicted RNase H-like HicB family nuclease
MKTYIFPVELEQEEDGRWSAVVQSLPGCATWGYTKEEALKALQEATQAYIQTLLEQGRQVPTAYTRINSAETRAPCAAWIADAYIPTCRR